MNARKFLMSCLTLVLLGGASTAHAQDPYSWLLAPTPGSWRIAPELNMFLRIDKIAWGASVTAERTMADPTSAIVGHIGVSSIASSTLLSVMGGYQKRLESDGDMQVFVQGLAGFESWFDETVFAIEPGAGVLIPWRENMAFRVGAGYRIGFYEGDADGGLRIFAGITLPLGD